MMQLFASIGALYDLLDLRERLVIAGLGLLAIVNSCFEILQIGLLFPVIATMTNAVALHDVPLIGPIIAGVSAQSGNGALMILLALMALVSVIKVAGSVLLVYIQSLLLARGANRVARHLYQLFLFAPIDFHLKHNSAELLRDVRVLGPNIFSMSVPGVIGIIQGTSAFILISALVLYLNPLVIVFAAGFISCLVLLQQFLSGKIFTRLAEDRLNLTRQVNRLVLLSFFAIKETQILNLQRFFSTRFDTPAAAELENTRLYQFHSQLPGILNDGILTIGVTLVLAVGILTIDSVSALPMLAVLFGAAFRYLPAANRISVGLNNIKSGAPSLESYLARKAALEPYVPTETVSKAPAVSFEREIRFEDVSYRHADAALPSVADLTFLIRKGEMIGIVGSSGAGKTTLANILLGLYRPQTGQVLVDGRDVRDNLSGWQKCLGYVPQQVVIADDSVRRNVAFGVDDADIDDGKVRAALSDAQLLDRIEQNADGLDAILGERGARLSGGEIQRIGIARALYRGAQVLVLDEATSALDSMTELAITELIKTLSQNVTIIVIAHRLSTLRNVDRVFFLKDGRLIEQGTFEEISGANSEFQNLLRSAEFVVGSQALACVSSDIGTS